GDRDGGYKKDFKRDGDGKYEDRGDRKFGDKKFGDRDDRTFEERPVKKYKRGPEFKPVPKKK
ncbi:MAG: hypothetical protein RR967_01640, partial [Anaerovoracaceae bacterium]